MFQPSSVDVLAWETNWESMGAASQVHQRTLVDDEPAVQRRYREVDKSRS